MEALIAILAEFLFVLAYPILSAVAALLMAIAELLFAILGGVFNDVWGRSRQGRKPTPREAISKPAIRLSRKWLHWIATPVMALAAGVIVLNYVFFPTIADFAVKRVEAKTGYTIAYDAVSGDIFTGRLAFEGLQVAEGGPGKPQIDLTVAEAQFDANIWTVLSRDITVEEAVISGAAGRIALPARDPDKIRKPSHERRGFHIENLALSDIILDVELATGSSHTINVATATAAPMRSRMAAFDLFFRSNLKATLDDAQIDVATQVISADGRHTTWSLKGLEMTTIAGLYPKAPFVWMTDGILHAEVEDRWDRAKPNTEIEMDWLITLENAQIDPSRAEGITAKAIAHSGAAALKRRKEPVELGFVLKLEEGAFSGTASEDLKVVLDAVAKGVLALLPGLRVTEASDEPEKKNSRGDLLRQKLKFMP